LSQISKSTVFVDIMGIMVDSTVLIILNIFPIHYFFRRYVAHIM